MKKRKAKKKATETLRAALLESEHSLNAIAKATDVSQPMLSRFAKGERGVGLQTFDTLCEFLGLELKPTE
jgi:transcriptional regulator with XRE-family HTH domain